MMLFQNKILLIFFICCCNNTIENAQFDNNKSVTEKLTDIEIQEKAKKLQEVYQLALDETKYKSIFFEEFPNSFDSFVRLYGYIDDDDGNTHFYPLYDYSYEHVCLLFSELRDFISINKFCQKLIHICIDGYWQPDGVSCLKLVVYESSKYSVIMSQELKILSDDKILSFWRFYFDGPHPDNHQKNYEELYKQYYEESPRIADLMKQSYQQLLSEHDGHGH